MRGIYKSLLTFGMYRRAGQIDSGAAPQSSAMKNNLLFIFILNSCSI